MYNKYYIGTYNLHTKRDVSAAAVAVGFREIFSDEIIVESHAQFCYFLSPSFPVLPPAKSHVGVLLNKHNIIIMYYITPIYVYVHAIYIRNNILLLYTYGAASARTQHSLTLMAQEWYLQRCRAPRLLFFFFIFHFILFIFHCRYKTDCRANLWTSSYISSAVSRSTHNILYRAVRHKNTYIYSVCSQIGSRAFILLLLLFRSIYF